MASKHFDYSSWMKQIRNNDGQPKKDFITYEDARNWVRRLGFENYRQWLRFATMRYQKGPLKGKLFRPTFIPSNPQCSYKVRGQWISDSDFLGTSTGRGPYISFEEAKNFARSLGLNSHREWINWHKANKVQHIPRYPNFVYPQWTIWADFLNSNFIYYSKRQPYIKLEEAIKIVSEQRLQTRADFQQWVKEHRIYNIPTNPDAVYQDFPGWDRFLGRTVIDRLEIQQNINPSVLYITQHSHFPGNVYEIAVDPKGKTNVIVRAKQQRSSVIKVYKFLESEHQTIINIIKANTTPWWEAENAYIVFNIYELLFQLGILFETV